MLTCEASFDGLTADSLTVDLSAVDGAGPAARQSMYKTMVETAKEGGDLELANEATYRRYVDLNRRRRVAEGDAGQRLLPRDGRLHGQAAAAARLPARCSGSIGDDGAGT